MRDPLDTKGLICGFRLRSQQPMGLLELDDIDDELGADPLWLHFNLADMRARNWIADCKAIPHAARDLLLSADRHIGFESVEDGMFAVIGDQRSDVDAIPDSFDLLRIFANSKLVVTVRLHPLDGLDRMRRDAQCGLIVETPPQLVAQLLRRLADMYAAKIAAIGDTVDETEERLLAGASPADGRTLGRVRGYLARLRRHIIFRHDDEFDAHLQSWCSEEDLAQLRRVFRRMETVAQDLELVQVRARLVQEERVTQFSEATNHNLLFLSVVTSLLLPVTLISGIFGMNVGGLPLTQGSSGFLWAMFLMAATLVGTVVVLRWRRLL